MLLSVVCIAAGMGIVVVALVVRICHFYARESSLLRYLLIFHWRGGRRKEIVEKGGGGQVYTLVW